MTSLIKHSLFKLNNETSLAFVGITRVSLRNNTLQHHIWDILDIWILEWVLSIILWPKDVGTTCLNFILFFCFVVSKVKIKLVSVFLIFVLQLEEWSLFRVYISELQVDLIIANFYWLILYSRQINLNILRRKDSFIISKPKNHDVIWSYGKVYYEITIINELAVFKIHFLAVSNLSIN
jgi:hypothetical protein